MGLDPGHAAPRVPAARRRRSAAAARDDAHAGAERGAERAAQRVRRRRRAGEDAEASWDDVHAGRHARPRSRLPPDPAGRQARQDGELLERIKGIRKKFAQDVGFLPPAVHIRDNLELQPERLPHHAARACEIGRGEAYPGHVAGDQPGPASRHAAGHARRAIPAFGLPAVWIDANQREQAQMPATRSSMPAP